MQIHIQGAGLDVSDRLRAYVEYRMFAAATTEGADLVVIPLSFIGDRARIYRQPPAPAVLVHDWIWRARGDSVTVSWVLLKRLNLVRR